MFDLRLLPSIRPGDAFAPQELLDARIAIEPAPTTLLRSTVRKIGLVVHGAVVDVYGAILSFQFSNLMLHESKTRGKKREDVPGFDLLGDSESGCQILGENG